LEGATVDMFKDISLGNFWKLPVLKVKLSEDHLTTLIDLSENSIKENIDWSQELVGEISSGKQVHFKNVDDLNIVSVAEKFIDAEFDLSQQLYIREAWVVSQFAGDYNPVHAHESLLSGILYLKVPPQIKNSFGDIKNNGLPCVDGCLHFIHDTYHRNSLRNMGPRVVLPESGDLYLFPSYILHTVYPFKGDGERRCIAFNMDLKNE
jgi:hypothetical protein